jgi:hypothetical protein
MLLKCFTLQLDQPTRPALTKLAPDIAGQCSKLSLLTCFPLLYIKWMQRRAKFLLANQLCRLQLSLDYIFYILRPMFAVIPEVLVSFLSGPTLCYTVNLFVSQCALWHILGFILYSFVYFLRKSVFCHCKLPMHNLSFCPSPLLTFSHLEMVLLATESPMPSHLSPNTKDCCSPYSATMPQSAHAISLPSSHLLMTLM